MAFEKKFNELKREKRQNTLFRLVLCVFILSTGPHSHGGNYISSGGGIGGNEYFDLFRIGLNFWGVGEVIYYITIGWWLKRSYPEFEGEDF